MYIVILILFYLFFKVGILKFSLWCFSQSRLDCLDLHVLGILTLVSVMAYVGSFVATRHICECECECVCVYVYVCACAYVCVFWLFELHQLMNISD